MAEDPLAQLGRVLGGVMLMQGHLGHQVLGQLMAMGTSDLGIAGATVIVAGASRSPNALTQALVRTAAPAVALHLLFNKQSRDLDQRAARVSKCESLSRELDDANDTIARLRARTRELEQMTGARPLGVTKRVRSARGRSGTR